MKDLTLLAARILLALIFVLSGWGKLGAGYAGTQEYMASMGVAGSLLPLVILAELGGGLGLVFGALTRVAAVALAVFSLVAALIFHTDFANQMQWIMFMKNLAITGGLLALAAHGPGAYSVDAWWKAHRG